MTHLKRVIKVCLYVNRMMRDGKEDDFLMKQVKGGEVVSTPAKSYKEVDIQVDAEELQKNVPTEPSASSESEEVVNECDVNS